MMTMFNLTCLGDFALRVNQQPVPPLRTDKVRALLVYLALEARPHRRESLAGLLWPEIGEEHALKNLRNSLHRLRQPIEEVAPGLADRLLFSNRQSVEINPALLTVDLWRFVELIEGYEKHDHVTLAQCDRCCEHLQQALGLYQGELLAGFNVADAPAFEEWLLVRRESLHQQLLLALYDLTVAYEARREWEIAQRFARRILTLEPWREEIHRVLMSILAKSGQRAAALAQYQSCRQILQDELGIEPDPNTIALYEEIRSGKFVVDSSPRSQPQRSATATSVANVVPAAHDLPRLATTSIGREELAPQVHNLPPLATPFVGRKRELAELVERLSQSNCRLLTLVGPGGMGKTRLAIEVAQRALEKSTPSPFADGVFFVSLATLTSDEALIPAITTTLGIELYGADPLSTLLNFLQKKQMMLILDNFEHLLTGAGVIAQLLHHAPAIQLIVTSRTRLNLQSEVVYQVPPLALTVPTTATEANHCDAVQLFVQRSKRGTGNLTPRSDNLPAILRICQLVEGMPLGLELAAAWSEWLPLDEIAREIKKSSDFLASDALDIPARQRSMRAVFEWSWKLLDEQERQLFCHLSIFRGGFTHKAAEQITGTSLRTLIALASKSLLSAPREPDVAAHFHVHELLRQFAAEQLDTQADTRLTIANRHSAYYLEFIAAREQRMARHDQVAAVAELRPEIDNVRQAWLHAADQVEIRLLDRSVSGLARFYELTGQFNETVPLVGQLLERLDATTSPATVDSDVRQKSQQLQSKVLAIQALSFVKLGRFDDGMALAQRATSLAANCDGVEGEMYGQFVIGQVWYRKGDFASAYACFDQLRQQITTYLTSGAMTESLNSELLNDVWYAVHVWLGNIEGEMGNITAAHLRFDESIRICQALRKVRAELHTRINIAGMFMRSQDYANARRIYEECLVHARNLEYGWGEAQIQLELGEVMRRLGAYSFARQLLIQSDERRAKIQAPVEQVYNYTSLACVHCYLGDFAQARHWLDQTFASPLFQSSKLLQYLGYAQRTRLAYLTGEAAVAFHAAQETLLAGQRLGGSKRQAEGWLLLGHTARALHLTGKAEESYQEAHQLYTQIGDSAALAEVCAGLALLALRQGDLAEAQLQIEEFLPQLDGQCKVGLDEPFFAYLTAYQVLVAAHDPRATAILIHAQAHLDAYVAQIDSEELRRSFLENVPTHRDLVAAITAIRLRNVPDPSEPGEAQLN